MTTTERRKRGPQVRTSAQQRRAELAAWYDHVVVERALRDWMLNLPLVSPGRRLTLAERRVVLHALMRVGTSRHEAAAHLRAGSALAEELSAEPVAGGAALAHRQRVERTVALLERLGARTMIKHRAHPLTSSEVDRICALATGNGDVNSSALFDSRFASPRK